MTIMKALLVPLGLAGLIFAFTGCIEERGYSRSRRHGYHASHRPVAVVRYDRRQSYRDDRYNNYGYRRGYGYREERSYDYGYRRSSRPRNRVEVSF